VTSVAFIVPAHGRLELSLVCLRQLRRTCDTLEANDVAASAVVVADDENLDIAADLEFATVRRENAPLGRKWNDGYQLACDPTWNPHPVDYAIPFGSDDWIDPELILRQVDSHGCELRCSRLSAIVNENATRICRLRVSYPGRLDFGDGVRVIPSWLLETVGYRPAEEDARRAIDTSVFRRIEQRLARPPRCLFNDLHPFQIVDWKTAGEQLNPYAACTATFGYGPEADPFEALAGVYPADALDEMRALQRGLVAA